MGIAGFAIAAFGSACSKDEDVVNITLKGVDNIETVGVTAKATDTKATFSVYTSVKPTVTTTMDWVQAESSEPSKKYNISQITLTFNENPTTEQRTGNIEVRANGASLVVPFTQLAGDGTVPEPEPEIPDYNDEVQPLLGLNAMAIAKDYKGGWNIGNTLEAIGGETSWGNPKINETYIQALKNAGFNMIRIPVAWDDHIKDKSTNEIDPEWLDRVNEVVHMVTSRGMYAIVNTHWDGGWIENNIGTATKPELVEKFRNVWTQIANRLGHFNDMVLFAGLNEPNAGSEEATAALLEYEQVFVDAVRATGGNNAKRILVFQGPNTDIDNTYKFMKSIPQDPSGNGLLMAEVHYYTPYQFCLMEKDETWGKVAWFWGKGYHVEGSSRNATWGEEDDMMKLFDMMKSQFVDKGIPVVLGEYGAYPEEHLKSQQTTADIEAMQKSRVYYYECVQKFGKERGILPVVWDTGELINRNNGNITKQYMLDAIFNGTNSATSPY